MKNKYIKILTFASLPLLALLSCNDENIIGIYNKYTESYRHTAEERLNPADTIVTVKVLSSHTGLPLAGVHVVLTKPAGDTIGASTDKEGFADFSFIPVTEGTYSVKVSLYNNGSERSRINSYHLHEKNNSALTIFIDESSWYN